MFTWEDIFFSSLHFSLSLQTQLQWVPQPTFHSAKRDSSQRREDTFPATVLDRSRTRRLEKLKQSTFSRSVLHSTSAAPSEHPLGNRFSKLLFQPPPLNSYTFVGGLRDCGLRKTSTITREQVAAAEPCGKSGGGEKFVPFHLFLSRDEEH